MLFWLACLLLCVYLLVLIVCVRGVDWLDSALHAGKPVVYVYLGDGSSLDAAEASALLSALTAKHFRVLWSLPKNSRHLLPDELPGLLLTSFVFFVFVFVL